VTLHTGAVFVFVGCLQRKASSAEQPFMYDIEITNELDQLEVSSDWLRHIVQETLALEQVKSATISVAVVDNATIWRLNRRHLQHDYPTDVLSFLLESNPVEYSVGGPRGAGRTLEGEVIVSAEMAMQMSAQYHWRGTDELCLYLVHGLLHLCGYDDLTPEEQRVMRGRERDILRTWQLTPHYVEDTITPDAESAK
jgi:probable rRNA maturation factor